MSKKSIIDKQYVVCYIENGVKNFTSTPAYNFDDWLNANPQITVVYKFYLDDELNAYYDNIESQFRHICSAYGLQPDDLNKTFKNTKNGHKIRIKGYKPRNRKYPVIIYDETDMHQYKVTPRYLNTLEPIID